MRNIRQRNNFTLLITRWGRRIFRGQEVSVPRCNIVLLCQFREGWEDRFVPYTVRRRHSKCRFRLDKAEPEPRSFGIFDQRQSSSIGCSVVISMMNNWGASTEKFCYANTILLRSSRSIECKISFYADRVRSSRARYSILHLCKMPQINCIIC